MPIDSNIPKNEIWFISDGAFRSSMDRANNPPEHLPSEESKWMATNDYGYRDNNATEAVTVPTPEQEASNFLNDLGRKTSESFETYTYAAKALSDAQSEYDRATRALNELKDRYQKAFFIMNENIGEVNEWLNSRQKSQSDDS